MPSTRFHQQREQRGKLHYGGISHKETKQRDGVANLPLKCQGQITRAHFFPAASTTSLGHAPPSPTWKVQGPLMALPALPLLAHSFSTLYRVLLEHGPNASLKLNGFPLSLGPTQSRQPPLPTSRSGSSGLVLSPAPSCLRASHLLFPVPGTSPRLCAG